MITGCDASKITEVKQCPKLGEKGNDYESTLNVPEKENSSPAAATTSTAEIEKSSAVTQSSRINNRKMNLDEHDNTILGPDHVSAESNESNSSSVGTVLGFIIPIGLVLTAVLWVFYAYRNPQTKSGQFLIQVIFFLLKYLRSMTKVISVLFSLLSMPSITILQMRQGVKVCQLT